METKPSKTFFGEFKDFAVKGNVVDLAVGLAIGTAFGKIVSSFVQDILMPPIGVLFGGVNLNDRFIVFSGGTYATLEEAQKAGAVTLNYGTFLNTVFDFLIIATVIFILVLQINRVRRRPDDSKECPHCLSTIKKAAVRCAYCTAAVS